MGLYRSPPAPFFTPPRASILERRRPISAVLLLTPRLPPPPRPTPQSVDFVAFLSSSTRAEHGPPRPHSSPPRRVTHRHCVVPLTAHQPLCGSRGVAWRGGLSLDSRRTLLSPCQRHYEYHDEVDSVARHVALRRFITTRLERHGRCAPPSDPVHVSFLSCPLFQTRSLCHSGAKIKQICNLFASSEGPVELFDC